jgi:hypothetical protein
VRNRSWFVAGTAAALVAAPAPAYAHLGRCTSAEAISTAAISGVLAVLLFRPWRKESSMGARVTRLALPVLLAGTVTLSGCGAGKPKSSSGTRPTTSVRVQITEPTPNQVIVGDKTTLTINVIGGKVVDRTTGPLTPTEGHIHVTLDGRLVSMAYQTTQELSGLTPGTHTATAEFVAVDHQPFKNRPTAAVIFQSQAQ